MTSSESATRFASNSSSSFKWFCGWLHALRSGGSASLASSHSRSQSPSSHFLLMVGLKGLSLRLSQSFDMQFFSIPAGLRHSSSRCLSWCCIRPCLIYSRGGVVSPAPRVMGVAPPAAPPVSVTSSSVTKKFFSDATLVSVSAKSCFACAWTSFLAASSFSFEFNDFSRVSQLSRNRVSMEEFLARPHRGQWMPSSGPAPRRVHVAWNVSSICSRMPNTSPDCGFVDLMRSCLRQRRHSPLLGFRAHELEHAAMRLHDVLHRLRHVRHLCKVGVVLLQHRGRGLEGGDPLNSNCSREREPTMALHGEQPPPAPKQRK